MPRLQFSINSTNVPQQVTGISPIFFRTATFFSYSGFKSNGQPQNNTGTVFVGLFSGEGAMQATPGASFAYNLQSIQEKENLLNYWFQGTQNDGLYIIYN